MAVYDAVVVGTDGSGRAARAVQRAGLYGEALEVPVVIATAFVRPTEEEIGPASQRAESAQLNIVASGYRHAVDIAQDASEHVRAVAPRVDIDPVAVEGDPADVLIQLAASRGNALLVVGNQGMVGSARFLLGSVPNKISHHAAGDILIAATNANVAIQLPRTILVGTDGSHTATFALERALSLAIATEAAVTVLAAGLGAKGEDVVADAAKRAAAAGVSCTTATPAGSPADELVAAGEEHDLVVVGNKGMTGAARFLLGSVPNKISHHAPTDLLIVRTT